MIRSSPGTTHDGDHLLIMARCPVPGRVKTRLIPALGELGAFEVYGSMVQQTLDMARSLMQHGIHVTVAYSDGDAAAARSAFGEEFSLLEQQGDTLGERLQHAARTSIQQGARRVLMIGTDCIELTKTDILQALHALDHHDVALGPASDGGYYLIGFRSFYLRLFEDIEWGTERVYQQTCARCDDLKVSRREHRRLNDIDFPEDLVTFRAREMDGNDAWNRWLPNRLSVILPVLNEAVGLPSTLLRIGQPSESLEIIVVDGGSEDGTVEIARAWGCRVVPSQRGRSRQMNTGAVIATGATFLFLHADTWLPEGYRIEVDRILRNRFLAGSFRLRINSSGLGLRCIEWGANWRSQWLGMPYGDQALFLRADTFFGLGGFRNDHVIMEDYEFMLRLRRAGKIAVSNLEVQTSARRWQARGVWNTFWINQRCIAAYHCGIQTDRIAGIYRGS